MPELCSLEVGLAVEPAVEPAYVEIETEGGVADDLVDVAHGEVVGADVAERGAGRGVDVKTGVFAELADTEEMGSVGDDDDVVEVVFAGDGGETVNLLLGVDGAGLGDDAAKGNSVGEKIVASDAAFGVARVFVAAAAEGDDQRRDLFAVEFDGVVEAGVEDRGWVTGVFGSAEDGDGIGGLGVVLAGDGRYLLIDPDAPYDGDDEDQPEEFTEDGSAGAASAQIGRRGDHRVGTVLPGGRMFEPLNGEDSTMRRVSLQG